MDCRRRKSCQIHQETNIEITTTTFNPIQTNAMPMKDKVRNMAWKFVNKTAFRFTSPTHIFNCFQEMESPAGQVLRRKN